MSEIDYRKEQAAAKLLEFFQAYELLTLRYAEMLVLYPEAAEELKKSIPGLLEIENAGKELLARIQKDKYEH
jgi:hypothetical protein